MGCTQICLSISRMETTGRWISLLTSPATPPSTATGFEDLPEWCRRHWLKKGSIAQVRATHGLHIVFAHLCATPAKNIGEGGQKEAWQSWKSWGVAGLLEKAVLLPTSCFALRQHYPTQITVGLRTTSKFSFFGGSMNHGNLPKSQNCGIGAASRVTCTFASIIRNQTQQTTLSSDLLTSRPVCFGGSHLSESHGMR